MVKPLRIKNFELQIPIIQGGMSVGISLSGLAGAVSKEGALGVIGGAGIGMNEPEFEKNFREANLIALKRHIIRAKEISQGAPIGINFLVAQSDFARLFVEALRLGVDAIFMGAGLPLKMPVSKEELKKSKTAFIPIVSSGRAATLIFSYWDKHYKTLPDAVVVEGPLAGGHLGFKKEDLFKPEFALENLVIQVKEEVSKFEKLYAKSIPVIAAGGIFDGKDINRFLNLGADGVQMGTRFVTTYECDASPAFKEAYIKAKKEDIVIIESPVGLPGRAIKNKFLEEVKLGIHKPKNCPWKCLKPCDFRKVPYCISRALINAKKGNLDKGFAFAGANAYRIEKLVSVKDLLAELLKDLS